MPLRLLFLCSILCSLVFIAIANVSAATYSGAKQTEYPQWFKLGFLDINDDIKEATKAGKRLMIIFYQPGCPYCNALVERNLAQKDIETKVKKFFDVVAINMWGDRKLTNIGNQTYTEKSFADALNVQFTPTILFFNEQGKIILRLNGYLPPQHFKIAIDWVADKKENSIAYRDYRAKNNIQSSSGKLYDEDFFLPPPYQLNNKEKKRSKPLAIFFEQKDCPNCNTLHTKVLTDKPTRDIISQFDTIQLDMWSATAIIDFNGQQTTAKKLAKKFDVKYAPTIIVFNKQGKEIIRSEAFFKTFHTQGIFHYVLSESYKKQKNFQRYLSARAEHFIDSGVNIDIWGYKSSNKSK